MDSDAEEPVRPIVDKSGAVTVTFTAAQAEALTDSLHGATTDLWPDDWISHSQAHEDALRTVQKALDGDDLDDCLVCLGRLVDVADSMLEHALLRASRAGHIIIYNMTMHIIGGPCPDARRLDPATTDGPYRGTLPKFIDEQQAVRWGQAHPKHRKCRRCFP